MHQGERERERECIKDANEAALVWVCDRAETILIDPATDRPTTASALSCSIRNYAYQPTTIVSML